MLERRLTDAADGVKEVMSELVPPPVTDLASAPRTNMPRQKGSPPVWRGPMIAVGTAVAIIAVVAVSLLILRGGGSFDLADEPTATTLEPAVTTTAAPTTTIAETPTTTAPVVDGVVPGLWDPILATTKAKAAPVAATCLAGTDPDAPGPVDQVRPGEGPWSNQAAVFDTHAGRIVYLDEMGETWTFDVCTNTWRQMNPTWVPYGDPKVFPIRNVGGLVYDVDSDRTIAFGPRLVSVYDANTNTWTRQSPEPNADLALDWLPGAVYDPVSGLVLVATGNGELFGYDVETDQWTRIGIITEAREVTSEGQTQTLGPPFLIGHVAEADRLAFLGFDGAPFQDSGALVDPRTGNTAPLADPPGGVMGGFGSFRYATGGETAYAHGESGVCRLDPATLNWDCNSGSRREAMSSAMVYDPINTRVVVISDWCCTWPGTTVSDDVWAIDFDTGEQVQLLATANTRIEQDGS
jgi:hypothetical protein